MQEIAEKLEFMKARRDTVCTKTASLGSLGSQNTVFGINLPENCLRERKS
jgi:hypothetical protein